MAHVNTVQHIYAAFQQGDIPGILDHLAEDVDWEYTMTGNDVPWLQSHRGRDQVVRFFEALGAMEFKRFEPKTFFSNDDTVVVLLDVEIVLTDSGARIAEEDEVHIWRFNSEGRVSRFGHRLDSHRHWKAFHGEPVEHA